MGKLKKVAESGQLWELISQQFFLQKIRKILLNAVLTPQESLKNFVLKKLKKKGVKKAKNMLMVFGKVVLKANISVLTKTIFLTPSLTLPKTINMFFAFFTPFFFIFFKTKFFRDSWGVNTALSKILRIFCKKTAEK